jgi:hypothetical protein
LSAKRVVAVKKKRRLVIKLILLCALVGAISFFIKEKKQALVQDGSVFIQELISRETGLSVKIGKISGKLSGLIRFDDVKLEDNSLPVGLRTLFQAKQVEFRYHLIDFLAKKFDSKIIVILNGPEVYWRPSVRIKRDEFPWMGWFRDWVAAQRQHLKLVVNDLTIYTGVDKVPWSGISGVVDGDQFELAVPIRHLAVFEHDITSEIHIKGKLDVSLPSGSERILGQIRTEGTILNWKPLPWESQFEFEVSRNDIAFESAKFLGGFDIVGTLSFKDEPSITASIKAHQYPLTQLEVFLPVGQSVKITGHLNLDARISGLLDQLTMEAYARVSEGKSGKRFYKSMDLHVEGVYPTLQLSDSRVIMEDDSVMKFADKPIEFMDLFSSKIYRSLIAATDQDNVAWGDWEFKRPLDQNQKPEFTVERVVGKHARLLVRKLNEPEDEQNFDPSVTDPVEIGFEYRLRSKDSVKFQMREDEKFVGVERKMSF